MRNCIFSLFALDRLDDDSLPETVKIKPVIRSKFSQIIIRFVCDAIQINSSLFDPNIKRSETNTSFITVI